MADDKFDPDESHFSDEELEAALAGFEKEFADDSVSGDASDTVMPIKQRTLLQRSPIPTRMMIRLIRLPLIPASL